MTEYKTKWDGSIETIDATVETGRKTQAGVERENYEFGQIPESDYLTCLDKKNDVAYVLLRRGEGAKQEIGCSCDYFKENRMICEHMYALRDIDVSKLETSPNWLVEFLQVDNDWHIDDNNKLVPPSNEEPPKKPPSVKTGVATCKHCELVIKASTQELADKRCETHEKVCKKNPAKQKQQGSPTVEPPAKEKPKAPVIPPDPEIDIGVGVEPEPPEEPESVTHASDVVTPIDEGEITDSQTQETIPREIAKALCNMQKTELFATTDSDNPYFKSKYADLASIWRAIREPLTSSGLAIMQTTEPYPNGITVMTTMMHVSGASYTTKLSGTYAVMRDKKTGQVKANTVQALGSLITYLRRYSLAALVGVASADDDGEAAMGRDAKNKR